MGRRRTGVAGGPGGGRGRGQRVAAGRGHSPRDLGRNTRRGSIAMRVAWALIWIAVPAAASDADAVGISRSIQARHLPWGTVLDPINSSRHSNQIVAWTHCGDSAIWTGHYLAAEAYRYKVTHDAEALANVRSAIAGIKSL